MVSLNLYNQVSIYGEVTIALLDSTTFKNNGAMYAALGLIWKTDAKILKVRLLVMKACMAS